MEIAYLTTEYPAVSHTFIRREILALEAAGHIIHRYSIQDCKNISDPIDELEQSKTFYCLSQGPFRLLTSGILCLVRTPIKTLKAIALVLEFNRKSERGLINHIAYFLEAALLLREFTAKGIRHEHVHFGTNAATVALLVSILGGPSYSFTVHGPDEFDAPRGFSLARKIAGSAFTVGISQYCSAQLKRWADLESWSRIEIVHCTVSDDFLLPVPKISSESNTIVCVGRLSAQKGIFTLLEAAQRLSELEFDFKIILAGDGELRQPIEAYIRELGLEDIVSITGWVDGSQVRELLLKSRGLVLPSFAEGLPVVLMEALAMKRPVVATHINGIPELVEDGVNGYLTIAGDIDSLIDGIRKLLQSPIAQLNRMGECGHSVVKSAFTAHSQSPILQQLLCEALSNQDCR